MKQENPIAGTKLSIVTFYRNQLNKFYKIGVGKKTENNVKITKDLINITENRLGQLSYAYELSLSDDAKYSRNYQRNQEKNNSMKGS